MSGETATAFPGDCAEKFAAVRLLARGGFGEVHLARQRDLDREVVVKLLLSPQDEEQLLRFENEAMLVSRLAHPTLVRLIDYGRQTGVPWIAFEHIEGQDLERLVARGPLDPADVVRAGRDLAQGLEVIHRAGILHRDVKPSNVIRDLSGTHRLLDFGIARSIHDARVLTAAGMVMGTLPYMAPELLTGKPASVASDLYALGALLHELACGTAPFHDLDVTRMVRARLTDRPPKLSSLREDVPRGLETLVIQLLEIDPALRPGSAAAVREELDKISTGPVRVTHAPTVISRRLEVDQPARGRGAAASVLALGLLLVAAAMLRPARPPEPSPSSAPAAAPRPAPTLSPTERETLVALYRRTREGLLRARELVLVLATTPIDRQDDRKSREVGDKLDAMLNPLRLEIETHFAALAERAPLEEFSPVDGPLLGALTSARFPLSSMGIDGIFNQEFQQFVKQYGGRARISRRNHESRSLAILDQFLKLLPTTIDGLASRSPPPGSVHMALWGHWALAYHTGAVAWDDSSRVARGRLESRLVKALADAAARPGRGGTVGSLLQEAWQLGLKRHGAAGVRERKERILEKVETLRDICSADEIAAIRGELEARY